jgi:ABC-type antimicrobial peptide transport system permease subunit
MSDATLKVLVIVGAVLTVVDFVAMVATPPCPLDTALLMAGWSLCVATMLGWFQLQDRAARRKRT